MIDVIDAPSGGFIVTENDEYGRPLYIGSDKYWTRVISVALPFKLMSDAVQLKEALIEDKRRYR